MNEIVSSDAERREKLMRRLGASLQTFIRSMETARELAAKAQNLHPTDFSCLGLLKRAGAPISPKQIIETLNMSSGSGTALLDRLEAQGYVRRVPNPSDRRSVLIELDTVKAAVPLKLYGEIEDRYRQATNNLTDADLVVISDYLESIVSVTNFE